MQSWLKHAGAGSMATTLHGEGEELSHEDLAQDRRLCGRPVVGCPCAGQVAVQKLMGLVVVS